MLEGLYASPGLGMTQYPMKELQEMVGERSVHRAQISSRKLVDEGKPAVMGTPE